MPSLCKQRALRPPAALPPAPPRAQRLRQEVEGGTARAAQLEQKIAEQDGEIQVGACLPACPPAANALKRASGILPRR